MPIVDWLLTGVSITIEAVMLAAVISVSSIFMSINHQMAVMQQANKVVQDYAEYNQYDYTHVQPQDVIAAVMTYRGFPAVKVTLKDGSSVVWSTSHKATEFKAEKIKDAISLDVVYDADITKNPNGEVTEVVFRACRSDASCAGR